MLLQSKQDQDRLGAKESQTRNSSKVLADCEDVLVGKITQWFKLPLTLNELD